MMTTITHVVNSGIAGVDIGLGEGDGLLSGELLAGDVAEVCVRVDIAGAGGEYGVS